MGDLYFFEQSTSKKQTLFFKMVKVETNVQAVYDEVRDDSNGTTWALITYSDDGKSVEVKEGNKGESYDDCLSKISDDTRCYIFLRVETGDELSKRAKFALLTFVGESVGALKKAKVSTDKADIKKVIQNFAYECLANDKSELKLADIESSVRKAGGANYGTGSR